MLGLRDWGTREYRESWSDMRRLRAARRAGDIPDTLLLVEHPAVITVGVQGDDPASFPPGLPVVTVERGGRATYHGPGQLVGYAVVDLEPRRRDVRGFVRDLEEVVIAAAAAVGVHAGRIDGRRGVWVGGERKIASVGVAVEEWVTFHGFALNVDPDLSVFRRFRPCGLSGEVMTSLARELGRPVSLESLKGPVARAWKSIFGAEATRSGAPVIPAAR